MKGIRFGEKHSYDDWGLLLTKVDIPNPTPKTNILEIPGSNEYLDLSEIFENRTYEPRVISFEFMLPNLSRSEFFAVNGEIANYLHGREFQIILDDDPAHFFRGRVNFKSMVLNYALGTLTFSCECDPYRYNVVSEAEPWLWGSFSFLDGVITSNAGHIVVNGTKTITLMGTNKIVYPYVTSSADMMATLNGGNEFKIPAGAATCYEMQIPYGIKPNTLTIAGNGVLAIDYRGVSL